MNESVSPMRAAELGTQQARRDWDRRRTTGTALPAALRKMVRETSTTAAVSTMVTHTIIRIRDSIELI